MGEDTILVCRIMANYIALGTLISIRSSRQQVILSNQPPKIPSLSQGMVHTLQTAINSDNPMGSHIRVDSDELVDGSSKGQFF